MKTSRLNPKKIIAKHRQQTMEYYEGWVNAEKEKELKRKLFRFSINRLADVSKKKRTPKVITKEVPVEITKEVPVEIIKEVFTEVPVEIVKEVEVIKEVEVPVEKEVRVPYEVEKKIFIPFEVEIPIEIEKIVEIPVEKKVFIDRIIDRGIIKEIEIPIEKIVEVIREVPVEVKVEVPVEKIVEKKVIDHEALAELQKEVRNLKHSQEAMERRYQTSLNDLREGKELQFSRFADLEEKQLKRYKRIVTYAYIITLYGLPQILGMILL